MIGIPREGLPSVASAGWEVRVAVGLRVNLLGHCALACPFQIRCQHCGL
jgi:hypothetical protein